MYLSIHWLSISGSGTLVSLRVIMAPKVHPKSGGSWKGAVRDGDWFCCMCGAQNYSMRFDCFSCFSVKPGFGLVQGWDAHFVSRLNDLEKQKVVLDTQIKKVDNEIVEVKRGQELLQEMTVTCASAISPVSSPAPSSSYTYTPRSPEKKENENSGNAELLSLVAKLQADVAKLKRKSRSKSKSPRRIRGRRDSPVLRSRDSRVSLTPAAECKKRPVDISRTTVDNVCRRGLELVKPKERSCSSEERRCVRRDKSKKVPRSF